MCSLLDCAEWAKGALPYYFVILLPILMIISPTPVSASTEFSVFRMQQYDLHGSSLGSRSSLVNVEARTIGSGSLARKCVLARLTALNPALYQQIMDEGAAALLVLLPENYATYTTEQITAVRQLEATMTSAETQMAVYFTHETSEVTAIYNSVHSSSNTDKATSAANALIGSLSSDGYQMVVSGSQSKVLSDATMANIYGRLSGYGVEDSLPTIAIVSHYDSFGAAPELSFGADSNGSGVIALFEIARVLSKLYSSPKTRPKMNVVFLLSAGAYVNYQGAKRFLEDQIDSSDSPLLSELQFALCLDTLANGESMYLHVSKKPRESSSGQTFFESLVAAGNSLNVPVKMIHKKINLQNDQQSWEHEKFSLKKLPAFTLSRLESPKTGERGSLVDDFSSLDKVRLSKHISVLLRSILAQLYNVSSESIAQEYLSVTESSIEGWISLLSNQPRSSQLLLNKDNALVSTLQQTLSRYVSDVEVSHHKADRRDPDWVFYDATSAQMTAYAIKPATFDFFLSLVIVVYLGAIHQTVQYFPVIFSYWSAITSSQRLKVN